MYQQEDIVVDFARGLSGEVIAIEGAQLTLSRPSGHQWTQERNECRPATPAEKVDFDNARHHGTDVLRGLGVQEQWIT
ncbi:hypothetical protein ABZV77_11305 [Streptomyces sp. NPDC004732]|uniref:hypothetical protein n=1 Tax=Streptomyces sp. NPDC004732 TaxID=3154290 RepID=UPI0033ABBA73